MPSALFARCPVFGAGWALARCPRSQGQSAKGAGATLRFMLPLSGLLRKAEIWHRIPVNMGVTGLFVAGVKHHSSKLCSSPVEQVQAPSQADPPSHRNGQKRIGKTPIKRRG